MSLVKNPIISMLQSLIGVSPNPGPVVLDDDSISMVLPVVPEVARRSMAGIETGWFQGVLENVHSGADSETSNIDPYNPGAAAVAPYPTTIPDEFDLWLLGVSGRRSSGAGDLTGAVFTMNPGVTSQGWGIDDVGAPVVVAPAMRIAFFDGLEETVTAVGNSPFLLAATGQLYIPIGIRLPRGGLIAMATEAAAAAEFQGMFLLGLFPAGLGQDVAT